MKRIVLSITLLLLAASQLGAQQLYNMSFDDWSKKGREWLPWGEGAPAGQQIWGTANHGLSILGVNGAEPEDEIVAVKGPGKRAAKLHSEKVAWAFAAGSIFVGSFVKLIGFSGAEITWGTSFTARPASLSGYWYYLPQPIDHVKPPYEALKGKTDIARVEVLLTDWDEAIHLRSGKKDPFDAQNDPSVIGRGVLQIERNTGGYVPFTIPIVYRDDRTPKQVTIVCTASIYGGAFTGGDGSILYLDEFRFNY